MYLNHFGLDEPPFRITPHTDFFFTGANRGATLEALLYAITHDEGIIKVSGEVGSGKTMLCRVLLERLPQQVLTLLLANPALSRDEILFAIAEELELNPKGERLSVLLLELQEHLIALYGDNKRVVLLIDEAHAMPPETLEQVRLLSNLETGHAKLLQIVLFGQPELDTHLALPQMRPLKERITQSFRLEPLLRSDVEAYLDFRMRAAGYRGPKVFSPEAVRDIVKASEGLTRRVNILADKALLAAFADNEHGITAKHVARAVRDADFNSPRAGMSRTSIALAGAAAGLALGLTLHALLPANPEQGPKVQPPAPPAGAQAAPVTNTPPAETAAPLTGIAAPAAGVTPDRSPPQAPAGTVATQTQNLPPPPPRGRLTRERFAATQTWLSQAPGASYSVQIYTASDSDLGVIEDMLEHASAHKLAPDDFHVYGVKIDDRQRYRLAYGQYESYALAAQAMKALPKPYRQYAPYLRSIERMRSQNQQ